MQEVRRGRASVDYARPEFAEDAAWLRKRGETRSPSSLQPTHGPFRSFSDLSSRTRGHVVDASLHQQKWTGSSLLTSRSAGHPNDGGYIQQEGSNGHTFQTNSKANPFPQSPKSPANLPSRQVSHISSKEVASEFLQKMDSASFRSDSETISFMQLQMLAFIVVFAASGLVPVEDILFVGFSTLYSWLLNRFIFSAAERTEASSLLEDTSSSRIMARAGTAVGLFLPLVYTLGGFARGNIEAVHAATPHLFLLSCQLLSENMMLGWPSVSLPVRVLLPIIYNSRRLFTLRTWQKSTKVVDAANQVSATLQGYLHWTTFGRALAVTNLIFWGFNLFCILTPFSLYQAFRQYIQQELEQEATGEKPPDPLQALKEPFLTTS